MDRNHFSARRLRVPGEPVSKAISCWEAPAKPEPTLTQRATDLLKAANPERKSTTFEYGSEEDKKKEMDKKPKLPDLFSGQRGPKYLMVAKPPTGVDLSQQK